MRIGKYEIDAPYAIMATCGLMLIAWSVIVFYSPPQYAATALQEVTVQRVLDGDTVEINGEKCRLADIDAPETRQTKWPEQPFAKAAKSYLEHSVSGKRLKAHYGKVDYYRRRLVTLYDGENNINRDMVVAGLAWPYGHAYEAEYEKARKGKFGLWCCGEAIQPHDWRHGVRTKTSIGDDE